MDHISTVLVGRNSVFNFGQQPSTQFGGRSLKASFFPSIKRNFDSRNPVEYIKKVSIRNCFIGALL